MKVKLRLLHVASSARCDVSKQTSRTHNATARSDLRVQTTASTGFNNNEDSSCTLKGRGGTEILGGGGGGGYSLYKAGAYSGFKT